MLFLSKLWCFVKFRGKNLYSTVVFYWC